MYKVPFYLLMSHINGSVIDNKTGSQIIDDLFQKKS